MKNIEKIANRFKPILDNYSNTILCVQCSHKYESSATCKAYPKGIPEKILIGEVDHKKPYKGDSGIHYTPIK